MVIMIPLVLILVFLAFKFIQSKRKRDEDDERDGLAYEEQKRLFYLTIILSINLILIILNFKLNISAL